MDLESSLHAYLTRVTALELLVVNDFFVDAASAAASQQQVRCRPGLCNAM
jgi:hypothetical protein